MSTLMIEFGEGSAVTVADMLPFTEAQQLLDRLRDLFENESARAEGWVTLAVLGTSGFRAQHRGVAVTFRLR